MIGGVPDSTKAAPRRGFRALSWAAVKFAAIVSLTALAVTMTAGRSRASLPPWATDAVTVSVNIPASTTLQASPPAVSADGRQVAWVASSNDGRPRIWTETFATSTPHDLPGTEDAGSPFWSPDGRSIGFLVQGQLKRIEVATGAVSSIAIAPSVSSGVTWSAENVIVFAARYAIFAAPASGGSPTRVARLNRDQQENQLLWPQFLPDNRHFLYVARSGRPQKSGA